MNPAAEREKHFRNTAALIRDTWEAEHRWLLQGDSASPFNTWMPFQPAEFLSILFECAGSMGEGREFLDIGCGPGTKMRLAQHFFGLEPCGIEIDKEMAVAAVPHGGVRHGDALLAPAGIYGNFDLIWLYKPFRDPVTEKQLEDRVMAEMKPGAILAGGMWETCPADLGWIPVVDDWELRRGAWKKPHPVVTLSLEAGR